MLSRVFLLCVTMVLSIVARAAETSPLASANTEFARAQVTSAIRWQPWNETVLAQAKQQNKPVYVFIGSPLSELTRATIKQTFTSEKTVAWINENFFSIFVDADAQPEVAALGQHFISAVKQLRGQPVHLWLTPDTLQPYDGANYLPPSEEWGKPGFLKAARAALDTWTVDPARARALATEAIDMMRLPPVDTDASLDVAAKLDAATKAWVAAADPVNGGFGSAPKLPEPELIRFLLTRDAPAREAAIKAARALVNGALRDPMDGGFYRRCIDDQWKEPYHQKLLVDQARIALALFDAAGAAKDDSLRAAGIGALDFVLKELRNADGTFAAALDGTLEENADSARRPKFVKVGSANSGGLGLLIASMIRSGERRWAEANKAVYIPEVVPPGVHRLMIGHSANTDIMAPPAGFMSVAYAMGYLGSDKETKVGVNEILALANQLYFDEDRGVYMATFRELTPGIAVRVPAPAETPSAEVLALLAGVDAKTADLIRRNLMHQIEYDDLPPGDILLGLSQGQK